MTVPPQRPTPVFKRAPQPTFGKAASPGQGSKDTMRLNKRMAELGMCSRREADEWIANGWVKVNGQAAQMGQGVTAQDRIAIDKSAHAAQARQVTFLLHKPVGYVSAQAEDGHTPAIQLLTAVNRWAQDKSPRHFAGGQLKNLAPAGRLDIDSTGLLVLTQDGRVARTLIGEDSDVEKEYLVRVHYLAGQPWHPQLPPQQNVQALFPEHLLQKLRHGLYLDGQALKPAQVSWQNPEQLRFVLKEGKKRQIRRMCELVGLYVTGLKRVRMGNIALGHLPVGQWRFLLDSERF